MQGFNPPKEKTIEDITIERDRQDSMWGEERFLPDQSWLVVLVEEVGEIATCIHDHSSNQDLYDEICQVASVCTRWMEQIEEEKL